VRVDRLVTHRFEVTEAPRAYDIITGKAQEPFLGVLLTYPQDSQPARRVDHPRAAGGRQAVAGEGVGVSVLGAGLFAGATLLPALKPIAGVRLRGLVSAHGLTARTLGESAGFAFSATSADEVLADEQTHAVFILTRHHLHAGQVVAALEAGKHVFVEKPLCLTAGELARIRATVERRPGQLVLVGFNRRFAPLAGRLREFVETGEPRLLTYRVNAGYLPPDHWTQDPAQGGGRLLGEGCHFLDFANWVQGEAPSVVFVQATDDAGKYRQDNFVVTLTYPSGGVATIVYASNGDKAAGKERVEVFSGGRLAVLDDYRTLELHRGGRVARIRERLKADKGHAAECAAFIESLRTGGDAPIPWAEIVGSTQAALAAAESLASGAPVAVR
jgi:predicted dehydrogenase